MKFFYEFKTLNNTLSNSIAINGRLLVFGVISIMHNKKKNVWLWIKKNLCNYTKNIHNMTPRKQAYLTSLGFFLACNKQYNCDTYYSYRLCRWRNSHVVYNSANLFSKNKKNVFYQTIISVSGKQKRKNILSKIPSPKNSSNNIVFDSYLDLQTNVAPYLYAEDPKIDFHGEKDLKSYIISEYLNLFRTFPSSEDSIDLQYNGRKYKAMKIDNTEMMFGIDERLVENPSVEILSKISTEGLINNDKDHTLVALGIIIKGQDLSLLKKLDDFAEMSH